MRTLIFGLIYVGFIASSGSTHTRPSWVPYSSYTNMGYGSSPASTILTQSNQIYNPSAWVSDDDTYIDTSTGATQLFHNVNLTITGNITGGTVLISSNNGYDNSTKRTTITWTVQGPNLVTAGDQVVKYDTFTFTDNGSNPVQDSACQSTNTVIWRYVPHAEPGGG